MKNYRSVRALVGFAAAALLWIVAGPADAAKAGKNPKKEKPSTEQPAQLESSLTLSPRTLRFGMSRNDVVRIYDRVIDAMYKKRRQEASPGVEMERLQYTISQEKQAFRRSWLEFDGKPMTMDQSKFRSEYAHNSSEAYMQLREKSRARYLFFARGRLWKTIDVYKLGPRSKWGTDFAEAVKKVEKRVGVEGRKLKTDPDKGREADEVDFADEKIHLRLLDWGKELAIAYVDSNTEAKIASMRKPAKTASDDIDPEVKSVLRKKAEEPDDSKSGSKSGRAPARKPDPKPKEKGKK